MKCFDCHLEIRDDPTWLGEDLSDEGGGRCAYAFHEDCAKGAWPLFELTEEQAREWIADGAFTNG